MPESQLRVPVKRAIRKSVKSLVTRIGLARGDTFVDVSAAHHQIWDAVKDRTMTGPFRVYSLISSVEYVEKHGIAGAIVECGVWRGGSAMAAAMTLAQHGNPLRDIYLYDTFGGMTPPSDIDVGFNGVPAQQAFEQMGGSAHGSEWCFATLEDVKAGMATTLYPASRIHYIKGNVGDTIPKILPTKIAILRLDTDWYDSTLHELQHLYPLLQPGGMLIIDDYGHWQGARKAVDDYLTEHQIPMYLHRVDYSARMGVKPGLSR